MTDVIKQAVAKASKPFLEGVGELLGHEFMAEERLELCGGLEAFMAMTMLMVNIIPKGDREGHEVIDEALGMTSPAIVKTILETAGDARDAGDEELMRHIHTFFTLAAIVMAAESRNQKKEE